jgi:hypothetical protein
LGYNVLQKNSLKCVCNDDSAVIKQKTKFPNFESLNPSDDSNETVRIIKLQKHLFYTMHQTLLVAWLYSNHLKLSGLKGHIQLMLALEDDKYQQLYSKMYSHLGSKVIQQSDLGFSV